MISHVEIGRKVFVLGSLDVDTAEWLEDIENGDSSLKAFLALV